jgi:CTP synthase (UTP-ammonia lyase)
MTTSIDLIIDLPAGDRYHDATVSALRLADPEAEVRSVRSPEITERVRDPDGVFVGPGSPYDDMEAVIALIRRCREEGIPTIAT